MGASERNKRSASVIFKKATSTLTAIAFAAAAAFLLAVLWQPAQAASITPAVPVETSLLLTLDKPQPPAPKVNVEPPSLTEEVKEQAFLSRELVSELNSWAFSASQAQYPILNAYLNAYRNLWSYEVSLYNRFLSFEIALFRFELGLYQALLNGYFNYFNHAFSRFR